MTKSTYRENEELTVQVKLLNSTNETIEICGRRPTFAISQSNGEGIHFIPRTAGLEALPEDHDGIVFVQYTPIVLGPGKNYSTTICLDDFFLVPKPGSYRIDYTMNIPYWTGHNTEHNNCSFHVVFQQVSNKLLPSAIHRRLIPSEGHTKYLASDGDLSFLIISSKKASKRNNK